MKLRAIWKDNTPYSKLLLTVGIVLLCAVAASVIATILASTLHGISIMQLQSLLTQLTNPTTINIFKIIQTFSSIGTFIIPALLLAYLFSDHSTSYLHMGCKPTLAPTVLSILLLIIALPLINYLGALNAKLQLPASLHSIEAWMKNAEQNAAQITAQFLKMNSLSDLVIMLFIVAIIPALGEELLFRGIVQRLTTQLTKNIHAGIWIAAIIFSAMHMQFYGFLPRMLLGALLGYLLIWSGNLWIPIIAHLVNNALAVIMAYAYGAQTLQINPDEIGIAPGDHLILLCSSTLSFIIILILYKNRINTQTYHTTHQ
ncbi:MAG: hypothetical protein RIQ89_474 [Bacteroidota bacterium]|jgi:membrane protease YdiL (CAAX protease family)